MTEKTAARVGKWTDAEIVALKESGNDGVVTATDIKTVLQDETNPLFGRSARSIQGKASNLKIYVVAEKVAPKPKDDGPTKGEIVSALVAGKFAHAAEGANGANKPFLLEVCDRAGITVAS